MLVLRGAHAAIMREDPRGPGGELNAVALPILPARTDATSSERPRLGGPFGRIRTHVVLVIVGV
jgi:hypothetical protein